MRRAILVAIPILACAAGLLIWRTTRTHASKGTASPLPTGVRATAQPPDAGPPTSPNAAKNPTTPGPEKPADTTEQRLGPFSIAGKDYIVILRMQLPPGPEPGQERTVVGMEIREASGAIQYVRTFPNTTRTEGFVDMLSVSVNPLSGPSGKGLLVNYAEYSEPSAPEPESFSFWQVFGVVDGKFRAFSGPIEVRGDLLSIDRSKAPVTGAAIAATADTLNFKVWATRFRLVYPVRIDWTLGELVPAKPCAKASGRDGAICDYNVLPEGDGKTHESTFVRLCSGPDERCANPERVIVNPNSTVQLLLARTEVLWDPGKPSGPSGNAKNALDDAGAISVTAQPPFLKIRVDGKEGWLVGQEDFDALSLPAEQ